MRTRIPSTALFLLVFILLSGLLAGCGGGGDQSGNGGSQDGGAPGEGEQKQQSGAAQEAAAPVPKIALGTVKVVKPDKRKIILRTTEGEQGGERIAFRVMKDATITLDDKEAEMAGVKEGQHAQIRYIVKNEVNRAREVALISAEGSEGTG